MMKRLLNKSRFFYLTLPVAYQALKKQKFILMVLIVISISVGTVPALKSELEASVVGQFNDVVKNRAAVSSIEADDHLFHEISVLQIQDFVDVLKEPANRFQNITGLSLLSIIVIYFVLILIAFCLDFLASTIQARLTKSIFVRLRLEGTKKMLSGSISPVHISNISSEEYGMAVQNGSINISITYNYILDVAQHTVVLIVTLALVTTRSTIFAIACAVIIVFQIFVSIQKARRLEAKRNALDVKLNQLTVQTGDVLNNREIILSYEQHERYIEKLDQKSSEFAEVERSLKVRESFYQGLSNITTDIGRIGTLLTALVFIIVFHLTSVRNYGDAYFLIAVYVRILDSSGALLSNYDSIRRSEAISKTYLDLISIPQIPQSNKKHYFEVSTNISNQHPPAISIKNLSFTHIDAHNEPERFVLQNCSFIIPAGKTTLLLGPSGCGKTTIARILLGFCPINDGHIYIGEKEIRELTQDELRLKMSYVSQGNHIITDSVENNLKWGLGAEKASEGELVDVLKTVGLLRKITNYRKFLDSPARKLSIGEQQRLSLARMMLDKSEIIIMDEPLTGVDIFTIRDLLPSLEQILRNSNRTVLMISHKLSFSALASHIVVLDNRGNVKQEGTPEALTEIEGEFASLYEATLNELQIR